MRIIFIILSCIIVQMKIFSQSNTVLLDRYFDELNKREISEADLKIKLDARGIDLEALKKMEPEEIIHYQTEIEGAIKELEQDKQKQTKSKSKLKSSDVSNKKVNKLDSLKKEDAPDDIKNKASIKEVKSLKDSLKSFEVWGQHIFRNKSLPLYNSATDIKAPNEYVLGAGDRISIAIWGISQLNEVYEISSEGIIAPARMPRIFLKGITLGRAKTMLSNYFRRFYRFNSNQIEVNLVSARTVQVNIVGEVEQFGSYTLPAINTVFNALVAAGGPNRIGSVRKINLIRNGKSRSIDIYKFLLDPSKVGDISLFNNDYIQVSTIGRLVTIHGAINRPFKYELLEGEELNKLLFYAGGVKENAITKTFQVERFENDKRIILDVNYKDLLDKKGDFKLKNGDIITVFTVKTEAEDFVFVKGEVRSESSFNYFSGMTIADLVKKIDFTYESDLSNAFLKRNNPDKTINLIRINLINVRKGLEESKIKLQALDELEVFKLSDYVDKTKVTITGAVRNGGSFPLNVKQDLKVKDLILLAGGLRNNSWNNAYLFRSKDALRKELEVIKLPLSEILANDFSESNIYIKPFDSVVVLSGDQFAENSYIEISGAVRSPGKYQFSQSIKLQDAITLADGFTFSAATNKVDIYRIQIVNNQPTKTIVKTVETPKDLMSMELSAEFALEPYDIIVVRSQPNFELQKLVYVEGEVLYPGPYAIINNNERISDIVNRAGGITNEAFEEGATLNRKADDIGYIVMNLEKAMRNYNSRDNILVKDKDVISIPKRKDFVRISGETNAATLYPDKLLASNNSINVTYYEGKRANFYIKNFAAGLSKNADASRITVEHANGRLESTKRTLFGRLYPKVYKGSVINVGAKDPEKIRLKKDRKDIDWGKLVADSIAQTTGVLSLILLIQRLN
ncbi:MAG: SLBB domain-containing protein [Saprospiraceae bacterium]|nr:SLBB domain-containing protein [Saprospiraceae bacterium]